MQRAFLGCLYSALGGRPRRRKWSRRAHPCSIPTIRPAFSTIRLRSVPSFRADEPSRHGRTRSVDSHASEGSLCTICIHLPSIGVARRPSSASSKYAVRPESTKKKMSIVLPIVPFPPHRRHSGCSRRAPSILLHRRHRVRSRRSAEGASVYSSSRRRASCCPQIVKCTRSTLYDRSESRRRPRESTVRVSVRSTPPS